MPADASDLRASLTQLIQSAGGDAAQSLYDSLDPPVDTGELRDSGSVREVGSTDSSSTHEIEFTAPQGEWTDQGTRPHTIVGNPYLAFQSGGKTIIVRSVEHPGTLGTEWFSGQVTEDNWGQECEQAIDANAF